MLAALAAGFTKEEAGTTSMLTFSQDLNTAEQQMNAIVFYLTAFGYIDGNFEAREWTGQDGATRTSLDVTANGHRIVGADGTSEVTVQAAERFGMPPT